MEHHYKGMSVNLYLRFELNLVVIKLPQNSIWVWYIKSKSILAQIPV